ncbi:MAG TPA: oxalate/formate MFS antiporter [Vicinamibacterales bacterium]|nr:oxalate/formate MFS antiporter [Vicinamibacterales bacterium]
MSGSPASDNATPVNRWIQLVAGVICMVMIANLQYGWTYFVDPIDAKFHWGRTDIQIYFTIFVATETWLVPIEGWFVDRFGPRIVVMVGGVVVALAWALNSVATSLPMLYMGAVLAGIGAGAVYGTCVGNALKWFADRRGFAAGLTAAGFGAGAAATVYPIITVIKNYGYQSAFLWFGVGQGIVILLLSPLLKAPKPGDVPKPALRKVTQSSREYRPLEMATTSTFWVLYVMFTLVAASGLVVTAQVAPIAKDYKVANLPVSFLFISSSVLVMAGIVDNVLNGLARPTFGWVSDQIGRENTMAIVFTFGAAAYWALGTIGTTPWAFILTAGLVYFTWGEIYSLFPAICTDTYGAKYAATNAGLLYTAKGTASFLVPAASWLQKTTGSWHAVFLVASVANLAVAAAALVVIKPMRASLAARSDGVPSAHPNVRIATGS